MERLEKYSRRSRIKAQHLVTIGCISMVLAYTVFRTNRHLTARFGQSQSYPINDFPGAQSSYHQQRNVAEDQIEQVLKNTDEDAANNGDDLSIHRQRGIEIDPGQTTKAINNDQNQEELERENGNDIAEIPSSAREHLQFVEEIPKTVNISLNASNPSLISLPNLETVLSLTTKEVSASTVEETEAVTSPTDDSANPGYVKSPEETSTIVESSLQRSDYQEQPTEVMNITETATIVNLEDTLSSTTSNVENKLTENSEDSSHQAINETELFASTANEVDTQKLTTSHQHIVNFGEISSRDNYSQLERINPYVTINFLKSSTASSPTTTNDINLVEDSELAANMETEAETQKQPDSKIMIDKKKENLDGDAEILDKPREEFDMDDISQDII